MKELGGIVWARECAAQNVPQSSKGKPGWGILFRGFALGIWCLAAGACAYPMSPILRAEADKTLTFSRVAENPKGYLGAIVIWGGVISEASQGPEGTRLLVIQTPLDSHGYPQTGVTDGEFIANTSESLDPQVYHKGEKITLTGEISGVEEKQLGPMEYPRPILQIMKVHPWKEQTLPLTHGNWKVEFYYPASPFEEPYAEPGDGVDLER